MTLIQKIINMLNILKVNTKFKADEESEYSTHGHWLLHNKHPWE